MSKAAETADSLELIAAPAIEKRILVVRDRQVMLMRTWRNHLSG